MEKQNKITGLDSFGLSRTAFRKLGSRNVSVVVYLDSYQVTQIVIQKPIKERNSYLKSRARRWTRSLERDWPSDIFNVVSHDKIITEIESTLRAKDVFAIEGRAGIRSVHLSAVKGLKRKPEPRPSLEYFCVRAKVAIQVEGETRGLQSWEERFVVIKAMDFEDAENRLQREWQEYAAPYMNPEGALVRWKLEEIVDVYSTGETSIDPEGTEIFSSLHNRRMKPEYEWKT